MLSKKATLLVGELLAMANKLLPSHLAAEIQVCLMLCPGLDRNPEICRLISADFGYSSIGTSPSLFPCLKICRSSGAKQSIFGAVIN